MTLQELTNGAFTSLGDVTNEAIEAFLGFKIEPGNIGPIVDKDGNPVLRSDGKHLCLSYTHGTLFAAEIAHRAGRHDVENTRDVADLPVPFWQPTDVILFSSDGYVITAMRSNATKNAIGICLTTAAGYPKMVQEEVLDGTKTFRPQTTHECAAGELKEETQLELAALATRIEDGGVSINRPMQFFPIETERGRMQGLSPTVARNCAVLANMTLKEIMAFVEGNYESVGFAALKADQIAILADNPAATVEAKFYVSTSLRSILPQGDDMVFHDRELKGVRQALMNPKIPSPKRQSYWLATIQEIHVTGEDFMHKGSMETLEKTVRAAEALGLLAPRHTRDIKHGPQALEI